MAVDFTELSIDELMQVEISSVSRKLESLFNAPAAVHVISNEDVKRSGMTSLAESLRMSPGMHVARIDENNVAVASRGFNDVSSNKLLVMTDGRTIYSALFSGVLWAEQQIVMEDLDRTEVIRGPGASLWGANAVNGVINISTKSARDTVGSFTSLLVGDYLEQQFVGRHGMDLGNDHYLRVFGKHSRQSPAIRSFPSSFTEKDVTQDLLGFRYDWEGGDRGNLTIQGDFLQSDSGNLSQKYCLIPPYVYIEPTEQSGTGVNLLGRWTQSAWDDGEVSIQGYVDYFSQENALFSQEQSVADLDAQVRKRVGDHNEIVAGAGVRFLHDDQSGSTTYRFEPERDSRWLLSAFVQDEFRPVPDKLHVTIGAKIEHNNYTGFELQPNLRVLFLPAEGHTVWASMARAARTPSRAERSARISSRVIPPNPLSPLPTEVVLQAIDDFQSEDLVAFEVGHRVSISESVSFDTALFYNRYSHLRSIEPGGVSFEPLPVPHAVFVSNAENGIRGSTHGVEIAANWQPIRMIRLHGTMSLLRYNLEEDQGSLDMTSVDSMVGTSPKSQFGLRALIDLARNWTLDLNSHYTSRLTSPGIDAYTALDIRLAWTPRPGIELSMVGRDLLEAEHSEFPPTFLGGELKRIPRSYYGRINWCF